MNANDTISATLFDETIPPNEVDIDIEDYEHDGNEHDEKEGRRWKDEDEDTNIDE